MTRRDQDTEAVALRLLSSDFFESVKEYCGVTASRLLHYDRDAHVLVLEDLDRSRTLSAFLNSRSRHAKYSPPSTLSAFPSRLTTSASFIDGAVRTVRRTWSLFPDLAPSSLSTTSLSQLPTRLREHLLSAPPAIDIAFVKGGLNPLTILVNDKTFLAPSSQTFLRQLSNFEHGGIGWLVGIIDFEFASPFG